MATMNTNRLLTTTRFKLVPKVVDTILNSNVLATMLIAKAQKWSGSSKKFPVKTSTNNTFQTFSGYDTFSTNTSDTRQNLEFNPSFSQITVSLPLTELSVNNTEDGVLSLAQVELASSTQDMADAIGTQFYGSAIDTGNDFQGLNAIVDDGTLAPTYGGLLRATYPTLDATNTASGGTLSIAKMDTLYNAVTSGSIKPTMMVTTKAIFAYYGQLLNPIMRINTDATLSKGGLKGSMGFTGLDYRGIPVLADEKCTSGNLYVLTDDNDYGLRWEALPMAMSEPVPYKKTDIVGNDYSSVKGMGFSWTNWIKPINQASIVGHLFLNGQFLSPDPKRLGKLTGINGI
jgi:hypothetical protein